MSQLHVPNLADPHTLLDGKSAPAGHGDRAHQAEEFIGNIPQAQQLALTELFTNLDRANCLELSLTARGIKPLSKLQPLRIGDALHAAFSSLSEAVRNLPEADLLFFQTEDKAPLGVGRDKQGSRIRGIVPWVIHRRSAEITIAMNADLFELAVIAPTTPGMLVKEIADRTANGTRILNDSALAGVLFGYGRGNVMQYQAIECLVSQLGSGHKLPATSQHASCINDRLHASISRLEIDQLRRELALSQWEWGQVGGPDRNDWLNSLPVFSAKHRDPEAETLIKACRAAQPDIRRVYNEGSILTDIISRVFGVK